MDWSILICLIALDCCRGRHIGRTYPDREDYQYPLERADNSFDRQIEKILKLIKGPIGKDVVVEKITMIIEPESDSEVIAKNEQFVPEDDKDTRNRKMRRINHRDDFDQILGVPRDPEDLPEAEPIHPGHTLIRPSLGMLKSAVKFPQKDNSRNAVYGNIDNLGITYGKTPNRIRYTGFRKRNELMESILDAVKSVEKGEGNEKGPKLVIIKPEAPPRELPNYRALKVLTSHGQMISEEENNANEILDENDYEDDSDESGDDYRRKFRMTKDDLVRKVEDTSIDPSLVGRSKKKKLRSKFRDRSNESDLFNKNCSGSTSSSDSSDSSRSSDYEKNEGNPYTVHKDKYKQNWLWNHFMDGDHMNINPYGPQFNSLGPTGAELFFGRKWWYFNQDDYKPFR